MKKAIIAAAIVGVLFLMNSCSCDNWFNNGYCEFSSTWLGERLK